ncbi:MAG: GNAT family N-acetyltransferase [Candidatus Thorarchaeota archaeon]
MKESVGDIEPAKADDLAEILALVNKTNSEWYKDITPAELWYEPFLTIEQITEMSTSMSFFIQRFKGDIVSVGSFGVRADGVAWIPLMTIRSDFQRRGLGSTLLCYLEGMAIEQKHERVILETDNDAVWAVSFYKKNGYTIFKRDKNPWGYHIWLEKYLKQEWSG